MVYFNIINFNLETIKIQSIKIKIKKDENFNKNEKKIALKIFLNDLLKNLEKIKKII